MAVVASLIAPSVVYGTDIRSLPWQEDATVLSFWLRVRAPLELSPLVERSVSLVEHMEDGGWRHRPQGPNVDLPRRDSSPLVEGQGPQLVRA